MPNDNTATVAHSGLDPDLEALMPSGSEIYDSLMESINEELLSENLPLLAEKHKGETSEEKANRMGRYKKDFAAYDKAYAEWIQDLRGAVKEKRGQAFRAAEEEQKEEEGSLLANLESQFEKTNSSPSGHA